MCQPKYDGPEYQTGSLLAFYQLQHARFDAAVAADNIANGRPVRASSCLRVSGCISNCSGSGVCKNPPSIPGAIPVR